MVLLGIKDFIFENKPNSIIIHARGLLEAGSKDVLLCLSSLPYIAIPHKTIPNRKARWVSLIGKGLYLDKVVSNPSSIL